MLFRSEQRHLRDFARGLTLDDVKALEYGAREVELISPDMRFDRSDATLAANGRTFRVKGKGVRRKDGTNGDVLATVEVAVPQKLADEAREALERYAALTGDHDPRADLFTIADNARGAS